jgi:hypothetical protein
LWVLNHVAVANISQFGGRFREEPIYVGSHKPPHFKDVPELVDRYFSTIHENWFTWKPTELAAYGLWRLLWIHPFIEGNGRTARATCYYLLCARSGTLLPGRKIVPERIRENRQLYYAALQAAGRAKFPPRPLDWPISGGRRANSGQTATGQNRPIFCGIAFSVHTGHFPWDPVGAVLQIRVLLKI